MAQKVRFYVGGVMPPCLHRDIPWWLKLFVLAAIVATVGTTGWTARPPWFIPVILGAAFAAIITRVIYANIKSNRITAPLRKGRLVCWQCGHDLGDTPSPGVCPECGEHFESHELWMKWATTPFVRLKTPASGSSQ
ncbi:MAG: hypothetical protein QM783_01325 [Phycisphaerales bacterium]